MGGAIKIGDYLTSFGLDKAATFYGIDLLQLVRSGIHAGCLYAIRGVPAVYDLLDLADDVFHDAADAVSGDLQSRIGLRLLRGCLGDQ